MWKFQNTKNSLKCFLKFLKSWHREIFPGCQHSVALRCSVPYISVSQLCPTLCDPTDFSTPGLPVHHQLKLMSIESVMPSNHLTLCCPLFPPSIFPSIRVFSNEWVLCIRWPKYWSFSFSISPSNEYSGLTSFRMYWLDLLAVQGTLKIFSSTTWAVCFSVTPCLLGSRFLCAWDFPGNHNGVGCHLLLQRIFPTKGLNPQLLHLLQWQVGPLLGKPKYKYFLQ